MQHKILFLYSELSGYFLSCTNELSQHDVDVHIVRWPVNKEAPFQFDINPQIKVYDKGDYNTKQALLHLIKSINPSLIVASGWMDKEYLYVCKQFKGKIPTVMSMDNHWMGTLKQHLATWLSPLFIHNKYSHLWIPGKAQRPYAEKLGFKNDQIFDGFYSADTKLFAENYQKKDTTQVPHRFLYVGRYVEQKGLDTLFAAFSQLHQEMACDWELWCVGTGPLRETFEEHPSIKHLGFKQPSELADIINQTGVFVLPSTYEPWGVVTHEMAVAGMPMIISDKVGAADRYVDNTKNGFLFESGNVEALKKQLKAVVALSDKELLAMSQLSHKKGMSWTPLQWSQQLLQLLK